jgi:hypothetical protein
MVNVAPELYRRLVERGRADGLTVDQLVLRAVTEAAGAGEVRWLPPTPSEGGAGEWPPVAVVQE